MGRHNRIVSGMVRVKAEVRKISLFTVWGIGWLTVMVAAGGIQKCKREK